MKIHARHYWLTFILLTLSIGAAAVSTPPVSVSPGSYKWQAEIAGSYVNSTVINAENGTFYLTTTQFAKDDQLIHPTFLQASNNDGKQQWKVPLPKELWSAPRQGIFLALSADEKIIYLVNGSNIEASEDIHGSDTLAVFTAADGKLISTINLNSAHVTGLVVDPASQNIFISTLKKAAEYSFQQGLYRFTFNGAAFKSHYEVLVPKVPCRGAIFLPHTGFTPSLLSLNGRGGVVSIVQVADDRGACYNFKIINNWFDSADVSAARHFWASKTYSAAKTDPDKRQSYVPTVAAGPDGEIYITALDGLDVYDVNAGASEDEINPLRHYALPTKNSHPSTLTVSNTSIVYTVVHNDDNASNTLFAMPTRGESLLNIMELTDTLDSDIGSSVIDNKNGLLYLVSGLERRDRPPAKQKLSIKTQLVAVDLRARKSLWTKTRDYPNRLFFPSPLTVSPLDSSLLFANAVLAVDPVSGEPLLTKSRINVVWGGRDIAA